MKNHRMTSALGAGFAALLSLAAAAVAQPYPITINFCPTGTNYNINCSNCTAIQTCSASGVGITIVGSGVTLNGNGNTLSASPGDAITVKGAGASIINYNIERARGSGIRFARTVQDGGYVNNVRVIWPALDGLTRDGGNVSMVVRNVGVNMARYGINNSYGQYGPRYIDMYDSWTAENKIGFFSYNAATQRHARNQYHSNADYGVLEISQANGGYYSNSQFFANRYGIYVENSGAKTLTLSDNSGYQNVVDCVGTYAAALIATNNSWTTNQGCVTRP